MLLDAITSSPLNVFLTIVCVGLAYLYYRNSSSSSSASTPPTNRSTTGSSTADEDIHQTIARIERQERDMIRQEQDEAYQQSLKADREKERKRLEEAKQREADERERKENEQRQALIRNKLLTLKQTILDRLPKEPTMNDTPSDDIVRLVIKLPDGSRIARKFHKSNPVKYLYWFVFGHQNAPLNFQITTNFPRRELPGRPPLPDDFEGEPRLSNGKNIATNLADSSSILSNTPSSSEPTTPVSSTQDDNSILSPFSCNNSNSSNYTKLSEPSTSKPNCEQSLEDAGLSKSEMLFVYDLEA